MVQVQISNNVDRSIVTVNEATATPKDLLVTAGINLGSATINLDGAVLNSNQMNTTLDKLGVKPDTTCYLSAVTKATNA